MRDAINQSINKTYKVLQKNSTILLKTMLLDNVKVIK